MASISNRNGYRLIQFALAGERPTIRLGKMSEKAAVAIRNHIEALVASKISGQPVVSTTASWIPTVGEPIFGRLVKAGLLQPKKEDTTCDIPTFVVRYLGEMPDAKPHTVMNMNQTKRVLKDYFGDRTLQSVTSSDAAAFQKYLISEGYAEATYRRHLGRCRQIWRAATKRGLYSGENPFCELSTVVRANKDRQRFIPSEIVERCIAAAPDAQWKLIIALSRYGGLRTPSETLALTWDCIDWVRGRIRVPSPKTEHHAGRDFRVIPMFPELRQRLLDVQAEATPGTPWVITRYREAKCNLRSQFLKIIHRAGVEPWPKLFHNLRASRQTELAENFPMQVVCKWIGNSQAIALEHYLTINDAHFEKALGAPALQKALQKALQQSPVATCNEVKASDEILQKPKDLQVFSDTCSDVHKNPIPPTGFEPVYAD